MEDDRSGDRTPVYQGVAHLIYVMTKGRKVTTAEAAEILGRSHATAYRCLSSVEASHRVPVFFNHDTGKWGILSEGVDV